MSIGVNPGIYSCAIMLTPRNDLIIDRRGFFFCLPSQGDCQARHLFEGTDESLVRSNKRSECGNDVRPTNNTMNEGRYDDDQTPC